MDSRLFRGHRMHRLFRGGTEISVGAETAVIAGLRIELSGSDSIRNIDHLGLRFFELQLVTGGSDSAVLLQVVEDETLGLISPLLARGDRVNRELQAVISIFLGASLSSLVVDDGDAALAKIIDSVNASRECRIPNAHLEVFFGMKYLGPLRAEQDSQKVP